MRILALITDAFGGYGGIALYNRHMLTALCTHPDCTEVVAIPRLKPGDCEPFPEKLSFVIDGINSKMRYIAIVFQTIRKNPQFNLIICGHINLVPIAWLVSLWLKKPVLLEIYGIDAWMPTNKWLVNHLVNKIDAFVSISKLTKNRFLGWINTTDLKGFILPNAIDADLYSPGPRNPVLLSRYGLIKKTVLMTLGRLVQEERYKGFDEVMELLPELSKEIHNVTYLIVGDGLDRQRLEQKAEDLGVMDRVVFAGHIPEAEKADHYRLADVYVMPSRCEGFGFVFLEAMACGIPVVASKVDGSREAVLNGKLGDIVDPTNRNEIKSSILAALKQTERKVPEGLEYFSFDNFIQRVHKVINQVCGNHVNKKGR